VIIYGGFYIEGRISPKEDNPPEISNVSIASKEEIAVENAPLPKQPIERTNPKDGAAMVYIPEGEFIMGSDKSRDSRADDDELPQRKVYLDGYWIYKYEVTVAQYRKFCNETGRQMPPVEPSWVWQNNHPIVCVTWDDAVAYCNWAGVQLPTEAQWEKAARGTDGRIYPWGNVWDASKCNNLNTKQTTPVGSYPAGASPYELMDMAGNVWEWCADWYDANYYASAPAQNPPGPSSGTERVLRGGSWYYGPNLVRVADRFRVNPVGRGIGFGFRCTSPRFPR
jgi:formylglycine-generating enzyme required for sulfatase activity